MNLKNQVSLKIEYDYEHLFLVIAEPLQLTFSRFSLQLQGLVYTYFYIRFYFHQISEIVA